MREFLHYIASILVDHPEDVRVEEETGEQGVVLKLFVRREDIGKVIGKQGRTARAIRNLVHASAALRQQRVTVHFVDS